MCMLDHSVNLLLDIRPNVLSLIGNLGRGSFLTDWFVGRKVIIRCIAITLTTYYQGYYNIPTHLYS